MARQASVVILLQVVRKTLLFGCVAVSALDMDIFKETYSRGHRLHSNLSSVMMTCGVSYTLHCERLCTMTSGCRSFFYNRHMAACQIHSDVASCPYDETGNATDEHADHLCYRKEGGPKGQLELSRRLLLGPLRRKGQFGFFQLYLLSNTLKTYPYLRNSKFISSIVYMPTSKRLLVSTRKPDQIWNASLDNIDNWSLVINVMARRMAVDEKRRLIFILDETYHIMKIFVESKQIEHVCKGHFFNGLTLFPKHQLICTHRMSNIYVIDYGGKVKTVTNGFLPKLASNPSVTADVLYYFCRFGDLGYLMQMSLLQNVTAKVANLTRYPSAVVYDGNSGVYMYMITNEIIMVDIKTRKVVIITKNVVSTKLPPHVFILL